MAQSGLPFAYGGPPLRGVMRATPEDFFVDEELGFEPDGAGEHAFVRIEKRGANTEWVARQLARLAAVGPNAVSYAGMKDRHAVTRQTFSIHLPGRPDPDWSSLQHPEFRVLDCRRHSRKLKRGAHKANVFRIVLRDVSGDRSAAEAVLEQIGAGGVPNYFGEQRFGRGGDNLERARAMFSGRRVQRHERGLLLSAARSHLFNRVLAQRVDAGNWNKGLDGEVWMLAGSHSIFGPEPPTPELVARLASGDIDPTGPLWGAGELRSVGDVAKIEQDSGARDADLIQGLVRCGLRQERRALVLRPSDLAATWLPESALDLRFRLNKGLYATVLIREICNVDAIEEGSE
ncbi:MAG TPA: tRNA pseudouridine(13) synthase TruD [Rhodanobacteraceae bacterium]|nr:tRNA pseudouridine(13) synthase TruD [Rhodanobacteraceae bacterium]